MSVRRPAVTRASRRACRSVLKMLRITSISVPASSLSAELARRLRNSASRWADSALGGGQLSLELLQLVGAEFLLRLIQVFVVSRRCGGLDLGVEFGAVSFGLLQLVEVIRDQHRHHSVFPGLALLCGDPLLVLDVIFTIFGERSLDSGDPTLDDAFEAVGGQGLDVVLDATPPGGDDAGEQVAVKESKRLKFCDERVEQLGTGIHYPLAVWELDEALGVPAPPVVEGIAQPLLGRSGQLGEALCRALPSLGQEIVVVGIPFGNQRMDVGAVGREP